MDQYDHYLNGATERNSRSWRQGHNNRTSSSKIARRRRLMFRDNTRNAPQHQIEALTDKPFSEAVKDLKGFAEAAKAGNAEEGQHTD